MYPHDREEFNYINDTLQEEVDHRFSPGRPPVTPPGGFPGGPGGFQGGPGGFPGGPGGFPGGPGGFPGGFPGGPGGFPGGPGAAGPLPTTAPPQNIPGKTFAQPLTAPGYSAQFIPGADLRRCLFRWVYIWQDNGDQYWLYPTRVRRRSVVGYRWTGFGFAYFGVDLARVDSFYCT